jgi:TM2 domain-containing membrane protein YozV
MQGPHQEIDPLDALRAERDRLRQKRAETTDPDIAAALDMRIAQIDAEVPDLPVLPADPDPTPTAEAAPEAEADADAPPAPPTPEQTERAEQLVRQARVEKMRNNRQAATDFLRQAAEVAPGSATVLEALGDDLAERRKMLEARDIYKKALALAPKNVGLERKYGSAVLAVEMEGSLDDQMRRNLSDAPLLTSEDKIASLPVAIMLSAVIPGSGHLVLGQTGRGAGILAAWFLFGIWLLSMFGDLARLFAFAGGNPTQPNLLVLVPLLAMSIIYVATLASLKSIAQNATRKPPERPKPPVDLPFE